MAKEVRNFPLLTLDRKLSPHREPIRTHAAGRGWRAEIAIVPYEFQRGGNRMFRMSEAEPAASFRTEYVEMVEQA